MISFQDFCEAKKHKSCDCKGCKKGKKCEKCKCKCKPCKEGNCKKCDCKDCECENCKCCEE